MSTDTLLSILIPTLESRRSICSRLCGELYRQIEEIGAHAAIEVLTLCDDGRESIGAKRNRLIDRSRGRFAVFVDDDDWVSERYVAMILEAIRGYPGADCIVFAGEILFRGRYPRRLIHSIRYRDWFERDGSYLRPPCHITPIHRSIIARYRFAEVDYSEDIDWALRISRDRALREEAVIPDVLYFYYSRRQYVYQWLLDRTQLLRHAVGLTMVNSVGLRQALAKLLRSSTP